MIGCVGDALLDVSVRLAEPIKPKTDTAASIHARQGGSAANVALEAARLCGQAKFIGAVGRDLFGEQIAAELTRNGVEICGPRTHKTGSLVALLDEQGEASMLTDRAQASQVDSWSPDYLTGLRALHVTSYALFAEPLATVAAELMAAAAEVDILVSVDVSSVAGVNKFGLNSYLSLLADLPIDVLLASAAEAELLASHAELLSLADVVVIKQGADPTVLLQATLAGPKPTECDRQEFLPLALAEVTDTVGAGDAFAAGLLVARAQQHDWPQAVVAGQAAAADLLGRRNRARQAGPA